jgi:CHAD domain-containing protein
VSAYLLPDGLDLDRALASHLDVQAGPARTTALTFYDTFDGRLHAAGLTLRRGDGRLSLIDREAAAEIAGAPFEDAPGKLFDRDLPPSLRTRLAPIIEMRALTALATVATRSRKLAILNDDEKTVVRLSEEAPNGLRTRVQTLPVRGYEKELLQVQKVLTVSLGLTKTEEPLADEAIAATGALPAGTSSRLDVTLARGQSAGAAAEAVLARTHAIAEANLPGTLDDVDSEFLHDLRVAVRRARSLLRELKTVFPERELERLREDLKWVQLITGETRDLDVQLLDFADYEDREQLAPLQAVLEHRRAKALATMKRQLTSRRATRAFGWWATLRAIPHTPAIEEIAAERIGRVYKQMLKMGRTIDDDTEPEALHELRKKGKELRYLLEFFGGLFDPDIVKPMIKALKALQDVLGRHQDFEVQAETLRGLTAEVASQTNGADALLAMGVLIDRLAREQHRARTEFADQFAAFAERRAEVKATFG